MVALRSVFGPVATAAINMVGGLSISGTSVVYDTDAPADPFLKGDFLIIDSEIMQITAVTPGTNTLTVTRGAQRSKPAVHLDNSVITKSYVYPQYLYDDDEEKTKIQIYTAFPIRNFKAPTIVVEATSGDASVSYVGAQEQIKTKIIDGEEHLYFSGILRLAIGVKIYASTMTDVEKISDFLVIFLRFFLRDKMADLRISYTAVDFSGISTDSWDGNVLYTATIGISNLHSEYELVFPKSLLDFIEQINIEEKVQQMSNELTINAKVPV